MNKFPIRTFIYINFYFQISPCGFQKKNAIHFQRELRRGMRNLKVLVLCCKRACSTYLTPHYTTQICEFCQFSTVVPLLCDRGLRFHQALHR